MTDQSQYADPAHRYRLDSMIATGGMGVVWRGTDTRLHREVAIKILKAEYAEDPLFRSRFEAEARSAGALHHPGIAGIYDYGSGETTDDRSQHSPYLVMELVEGQPLSTLLANAKAAGRPLDIAVTQDLLAQTAEALAVAHRAGIVHRDIKPANLLVTSDRQVKITDFGIARAADSVALTRTGSVMGTPQYLSPEQARGNPSTPASDVYSLGVVAFECLAGRRPFEAETPVATALAHLQQPVPPLPANIPGALASVVSRALSKDPKDRYADGAALAAALLDPAGAGAVGGAAATPAEGSTQVLTGVVPPVAAGAAAAAAAARPPAESMRRLDTPSAYDGDAEKEKSGASPWPIALGVIALVVAVVLLIALLTGGDDDPVVDDTPSRTASSQTSATEETSASEPTTEATTEETSEAPQTYEVDDSRYACVVDYEQAVEDLRSDGFQVNWQQDSTANDGSCPERTVSRFSDNGTLQEGAAITVFYWGPVEQTEPPETTPTDETPTDPVSELTEGIGG